MSQPSSRSFTGPGVFRYGPEEPHEWVQVYDLRTGEPSWIAREYVYYGGHVNRHRWVLSTSSGCAAGSTAAEVAAFRSARTHRTGRLRRLVVPTLARRARRCIPALRLPVRAQLPGVKVEACPLTSSFGVPVGIAPVHADTISSIGTACDPGPLKALDVVINVAWTYTPDRMSMCTCDPDRIKRLSENSRLVHDIDDHPCCAAPKRTRTIGASVGTGEISAWKGSTCGGTRCGRMDWPAFGEVSCANCPTDSTGWATTRAGTLASKPCPTRVVSASKPSRLWDPRFSPSISAGTAGEPSDGPAGPVRGRGTGRYRTDLHPFR
ncbi:YcaO-like family protein [Corynebacterium meridianum]|uniref:YcaO-like family protein n=1 Tax=Corynebacterium meridianum TaxID=2765363 RepID=UPI003AB95C65